jgi:PAS domain-containing protein
MRHAAIHPSLAERVDLRRFIAALRDPVLVLEAETRSIVYSNLPAEALFGYTAQELVGL